MDHRTRESLSLAIAIVWLAFACILPTRSLGVEFALTMEQRLEQQDQRIRELERRLEEVLPSAELSPTAQDSFRPIATSVAPADSTADAGEGWEEVSGQRWTHQVGGRLLTDTVMWPRGDGIPNTFNYTEIRQVRLSLRGTGYGVFDYRVQVDFEPEIQAFIQDSSAVVLGAVGIKDAYVGVREIPLFNYVRIGHFKVSFSHDQLLSRRDMTFMERFPMADPPGFTPGRDLGVQSYNHSENERVTWQFGAFYDSISETVKQRVDDNQGILANGRLTWTPVFDEPSEGRYLVHLGVAGIYAHTQDDSGRFAQRPEIHEGPFLIDTGTIRADDYTVVGTELLVHWGPIYMNHELMWSHVNALGGDVDLYSGYVETGWYLTGEHRSYSRDIGVFSDVTPFENFWLVPGCRGRGAWEVAARWSFVDFTRAPSESTYNSLNLALNWYWTPRLRAQLNWIQPFISGGTLGNRDASILGLRMAGYF